MKKLLINASFPDEMRIAVLDGNRLQSLEMESYDSEEQQNNVYKGQVTNIVPSIDAAFVDFGSARNGFLPIRNIADEFRPESKNGGSQESIENLLQVGDELIVQMQVDRGQHENKGALLTTVINLAGQYLILHPNAPNLRRMQRKIPRKHQAALQQMLQQVELPQGMGLTLRAESQQTDLEGLQKEALLLAGVWEQVQEKARDVRGPALLMREPQGLFRALRDHLNNDVREALVDTPRAFRMASEWAARNKPDQEHKIIFYDEPTPLFVQYKIEAKVESIHQRKVPLSSGGSLIFDHTAAMTTIDVNSGSIHGDDMEDTAVRANQEAAREIAQQLRFRDIGGQIVIDFIDMEQEKNRQAIEETFRKEMARDNARPNIGSISEFGLLCMTRKRLRPSADDTFMRICPSCSGHGKIRTTRSLAMAILRFIEFEASKKGVSDIHVLTPTDEDLAATLFNEKRDNLLAIEEEYSVKIAIIPSAQLRFPNYKLQSYRESPNTAENQQEKQPEKQAAREELRKYRKSSRQPALEKRDESLVDHPYQTDQAAAGQTGKAGKAAKPGWLRRLWRRLTQGSPKAKKAVKQTQKPAPQRRRRNGGQPSRQRQSSTQRRGERKQPQRRSGAQQPRQQRAGERKPRTTKPSAPPAEAQDASSSMQAEARPRGRPRRTDRQAPTQSLSEERSVGRRAPETGERPPAPPAGRRPPEPGERPPGPPPERRRPPELGERPPAPPAAGRRPPEPGERPPGPPPERRRPPELGERPPARPAAGRRPPEPGERPPGPPPERRRPPELGERPPAPPAAGRRPPEPGERPPGPPPERRRPPELGERPPAPSAGRRPPEPGERPPGPPPERRRPPQSGDRPPAPPAGRRPPESGARPSGPPPERRRPPQSGDKPPSAPSPAGRRPPAPPPPQSRPRPPEPQRRPRPPEP